MGCLGSRRPWTAADEARLFDDSDLSPDERRWCDQYLERWERGRHGGMRGMTVVNPDLVPWRRRHRRAVAVLVLAATFGVGLLVGAVAF